MYCPVDGDEYREGITRCPEHDVDLVEEPPEYDEPPYLLDGISRARWLRVTFLTLVTAAIVYAVASATYWLLSIGLALSSWNLGTGARIFFDVSSGAYAVLIGTIGVLGGTILARTYSHIAGFTETSEEKNSSGRDNGAEPMSHGPTPALVMRFLCALLIVFALLWATTGILTAGDQAEYATTIGRFPLEEPDDSFITLTTLNSVAYFGGVACLVIMGAVLGLAAHRRLDGGEPA